MKDFRVIESKDEIQVQAVSHALINGEYRFYVLNEDDSQYDIGIEQGVWQKNLLTDGFMNQLPNFDISAAQDLSTGIRRALAIGTGTGNVKIDSGAITASQTGFTVTASAGIFTAAMVGEDIYWDTFERAKVTVFNSTTSVTVDRTQTVASGLFTVEFVSRAALVTEVQRSLFADTDGGFLRVVTNTIVGNEYLYENTETRVLTLTANQNLTEYGLFTALTGGTLTVYELFRDTFGTPIVVTIPTGKKVRLDHKVTIRIPYLAEVRKFEIERLDAASINQPVITAATGIGVAVVITAAVHGFLNGQEVRISGVGGNTAANGDWIITFIDANSFSLNGSSGNGVYTSGGKVSRLFTATCTLHGTSANLIMLGQWNPQQIPGRLAFRLTTGVNSAANSNSLGTGDTVLTTGFSAIGKDSYTNGTFQIRKFVRLAEAQAVGTLFGWRFIHATQDTFGYKVVIDPASWTKISTNTLELAYLCVWARG